MEANDYAIIHQAAQVTVQENNRSKGHVFCLPGFRNSEHAERQIARTHSTRVLPEQVVSCFSVRHWTQRNICGEFI
jgi:hypothetical protein